MAALVALIAGLPGLMALPVLDRDEAAFAQATAQMLESGGFIDVPARDQTGAGQPIGLHWLQAASVSAFSSAEARAIWAYRIPSLLGAMLAAGACAWGAAAFFGPGAGLIAGGILAGCMILSTEAGLGKPDALLCGAITLALAAMARLYAEAKGPEAKGQGSQGERTRVLFWLALALAVLDKGLVGPMMVALTGAALWICDRQAPWARRLGWTWGLILFTALVGPWLAAVTVRTDGLAWSGGPGFGMAGQGAPPGLHALASPLLLFPAAALLPAALIEGWKARAEPGPRFALCWLIPNWLAFEAAPTRLIHHALPLYGALAWLAAFALTRPLGLWSRIAGAALSVLAGAAIAALGMWPRWRPRALAAAGALGIGAHATIAAGLAPGLGPLWLTRGVVEALDHARLDPRDGLTPGPVTVVGYDEPSIVFALGTETELGDVNAGAEAISEGRPVVIEQSDEPAFQRALTDGDLKATLVANVAGLDYAKNQMAVLGVYRSDSPPPESRQADASGGETSGGETGGAAPAPAQPKSGQIGPQTPRPHEAKR